MKEAANCGGRTPATSIRSFCLNGDLLGAIAQAALKGAPAASQIQICKSIGPLRAPSCIAKGETLLFGAAVWAIRRLAVIEVLRKGRAASRACPNRART